MRLCFLGTPDFGIPSLQMCVREGHDVAAVVTQPDRPQGRDMQVVPCPLKREAVSLGLPVLSFEKINAPEALDVLRGLAPEVMVTAAYGQILGRRFLAIPSKGVVNVHGSLLPRYRGAAPIQWAVIDGCRETGITTMLTERGVDTGDILLQKSLMIGDRETAGELFARMAQLGAEVLRETLSGLEKGTITPRKQDEAMATHCRMLVKEDGYLDFSQDALALDCRVRGVTPWPGASALFRGKAVKILRVRAVGGDTVTEPGCVVFAGDEGIGVAAGRGILVIERLQEAGKKPMDAADYLRGHPIGIGEVWETCR